MNAQKYTQKSLEAVQNAQSIATEYGNQQIEQPHLLLALLLDEGGLIPQLLGNMGLTVPSFTAAAKAEVEKLPRVSGSGREQGKIYVAQDVDKCLNTAESIAASGRDVCGGGGRSGAGGLVRGGGASGGAPFRPRDSASAESCAIFSGSFRI